MAIETTININTAVLLLLNNASFQLGVSRNEIIAYTLILLLKKNQLKPRTFTRVEYQKRNSNVEWKKIHLILDPDLYEKCIDLRKIFKFSVSFLISFSIQTYLCDITKEKIKSTTDNYSKNYIFTIKNAHSVTEIIIYWGITEDIKQKLLAIREKT